MDRSVDGKYIPLQNYLKKLTSSKVTLSFNDIETFLNASLPDSAYKYQAWWVNSEKAHSHALIWLEAGYLVENVMFGKYVEFTRIEDTEKIHAEEKSKAIQSDIMDGLANEKKFIERLSSKIDKVRDFLITKMPSDFSNASTIEQYEAVKGFRRIIGNLDNDLSFLGCLQIEEYLYQKYSFSRLNVTLKPQGAPGLDIDETTVDRERIIGELKTTYPYKDNDLGSNQKSSFMKDFEKLQYNDADFKYFFVTELKTFDIVRSKYSQYLTGLKLVLLPQALSNTEFVISYE